ncbi:MAG: hypothetical protein JWL67_1083 [Solirubrobacterales bacterium]|nr:hypothetical protein [Solirubrobacterales bacterium]
MPVVNQGRIVATVRAVRRGLTSLRRRVAPGSRGLRRLALLISLPACCAPVAVAGLPPGGLAPTPRSAGGTVQWTSVGVESRYKIAISTAPRGDTERATSYVTVPRSSGEEQSYTPEVPEGQTLYIGLSADDGSTWSSGETTMRAGAAGEPEAESPEVVEEAVARGEGPAGEAPPAGAPASGAEAAVSRGAIIGTNDGAGWGEGPARTIIAGHITWNRVELGAQSNGLAESLHDGFKVLAIAGNTNDSTPLSQTDPKRWGEEVVSELRANPGISIAEAGNEVYLKGGVANPVQYGRMYLAAVRDMATAGIHTPLLFNMTGDYPRGTWASPGSWSEDSKHGGWLRDAVNGVPGLAAAIRANGIAIHPYGALGQNTHDVWGVSAAAADEAVAGNVLGSIPPFYITEFGYDLNRCGDDLGACSTAEQASKLRAAYKALLADPHVAGIWWYQSHDDGNVDRFGFLSDSNTPRAAFRALSAIAAAAGQ